jgi:acid stress-induced BolA-like protein IbaG/YrbA
MTIREQVTRKILGAIPDAEVEVVDLTGTDNHLEARVVSPSFAGKSPVERHRMVYSPLREWIDDDTVHALSIRTWTPDQLGAVPNNEEKR